MGPGFESQRDHKKNATRLSGIFLSLKLGLGPKGSIRRRLRVVLGECGAEPIPAGSQKSLNASWGFFVPFRAKARAPNSEVLPAGRGLFITKKKLNTSLLCNLHTIYYF